MRPNWEQAARDGSAQSLTEQLAAGADLDVTAKFGLSAVMLAALNGHETIARLLRSAGADLSLTGSGAPGFHGKTAADLARARGLEVLALELSP